MKFGLYLKSVLLMVSLAVIPVAFVGFQLINLNKAGIQAAVLELHTKLAENLAESVEYRMGAIHERVRFTLDVLRQKIDWSRKQSALEFLIESDKEIAEVAIVDSQGREILKVLNPDFKEKESLASHLQRPGFRAFMESNEQTARWVPGKPVPGLDLYYPIPGTKGYSLFASVYARDLRDRITRERVGGTGFCVLINRSGNPVLYPPERLTEEDIFSFADIGIVRQALGARTIGSSEFENRQGVLQVGAYAPVPVLGGAVIILQPYREAYAAAHQMRVRAVIILVVFALLALAVAYFAARHLSRPVLAVTNVAKAVAQGDFSQQVKITATDELKDLAETFNYMTSQLRKYAEIQVDQIIAEQQKTEAILFSIDDGILMTDYEGRVQLANRMARSVLGLDPSESLEGKTIQGLVGDDRINAVLKEVSAGPDENAVREMDLSDKDYRKFFKVSARPVVVPLRGTKLGVVTAIRDITLEKELEKMKEEFVHYMTHDLKGPLSTVRGFLELLMKDKADPLTPRQRKVLESMDRASFRLYTMIINILDVAKIRVGKMEINLEKTSLEEVAKRTMEFLKPVADGKQIALSVFSDTTPEIQADGNLLERVFMNLVRNAIKFTPNGGSISISMKDGPDHIQACVVDTGCGIPADAAERIFESFEQVDGQRGGGTGLGLTICKHIVEGHKGRIWVESELKKGSRFYFTIPKNLT